MSKYFNGDKLSDYEDSPITYVHGNIEKFNKVIADLDAKLAEKDKEIAYLTEQVKKFNNEAQKYFEDAYCNDFHKRDKISFAIEELENVKKFVNDIYGEYSASVITNFIDNQIKSLK